MIKALSTRHHRPFKWFFRISIPSRYVKVNPYDYVWQNSGFRIRNSPLWIWNLIGLKCTDINLNPCRYVSQNSLKSCMTEYLYFVGQGVLKKPYKNHLKGKLYMTYTDLTKTAFRHTTSNKNPQFRHATSCKTSDFLAIQTHL